MRRPAHTVNGSGGRLPERTPLYAECHGRSILNGLPVLATYILLVLGTILPIRCVWVVFISAYYTNHSHMGEGGVWVTRLMSVDHATKPVLDTRGGCVPFHHITGSLAIITLGTELDDWKTSHGVYWGSPVYWIFDRPPCP